MNRRRFFKFLPSAGISTVGSLMAAFAAPVRAEDIEGMSVENGGTLVIENCLFTTNGPSPAFIVKQF